MRRRAGDGCSVSTVSTGDAISSTGDATGSAADATGSAGGVAGRSPKSPASLTSGVASIALIAAICAVPALGAAPATAAAVPTKPKPSVKELTAQEKKLSDQAEQLTEQYNGLQVRLKQAKRAAKIAEANAARQQKALDDVRAQVAQMAADAYKTGGDDPVAAFIGSGDYQGTLDRAATVNFFARQNNAQVTQLLQTMQAADRARKQAESRATEVRTLTDENKRKQREVTTLLAKVEKKLGRTAAASGAGGAVNVPSGGASAKALGALKAALAVRGTPYSWGGGNASGPTYGVAQGAGIKGFDCSGLTLYAYAQVGISLPHYTGSQFNAGTHVSMSQLRPGDLVFFHSDLHHMGMYIGNGKMVHAPQTGDVVKISPISGRPFAGGVRIA